MKRTFVLSALCIALLTSTALGEVQTRQVRFENEGEPLVGTLYAPTGRSANERFPGVVVTGAWTSIKEQMSGLYAREMAERGFVALAFDFRGWGQSGGRVRFKEEPTAKISDILAAAVFMATLPEVDPARISGLGICASAGYMAAAASVSANIASVGLVAPWLHDADIVRQVYGGEEGVHRLIETSQRAEASEAAGKPQVILAASATDRTALMFQVPYYTEMDRGLIPEYDNKFNLASWEPWLTYDSVVIADRLHKPTLMVHSEAAAVPQGAHAFFNRLPGHSFELWLDNVSQFDFYDRPEPVAAAADAVAAHFERFGKEL